LATPATALLAVALLASCGGGGVVPSTSVATTQNRTQTPQFAEFISRKAVAYSPFRSFDRDTELITPQMIKEDLELLLQGDFRLIRLFDSADHKAAKVVKSATAEPWAGTTVSTGANLSIPRIPFTSTARKLKLRVWAAGKDIPVRLKVENSGDASLAAETEALTTVAYAWQTLEFDFGKPAAGTAALNPAVTYDKVSVFFDYGKSGAAGGGGTFYFDTLSFVADDGRPQVLITFEEQPAPRLTGFGGAENSAVVVTGVARLVLESIRDNGLDIKMQLGAYILSESSPSISDEVRQSHVEHNRAEVARAVALANEFPDIVLAVSIGNETMVSWSFVPTRPDIMAAYIAQVRAQIKQPVTTNDNWAFYADAPKAITDIIDFAAVHTYCELDTVFIASKWDWMQENVEPGQQRAKAMMDAAMACAESDYQAVRDWLDKKGQAIMPIVIGETGWNAVDVGSLAFRAHPVNQKMYFQALQEWKQRSVGGKGPSNIFYFEAFDEPWKGGDDKWGLFNVSRQARYVVQSLYPQSLWEAGTFTDDQALYWVAMSNDRVVSGRYTLYAETVTPGEARPATPTLWNAWENGKSATAKEDTVPTPPEGTKSFQITPNPEPWGWGMAMNLKDADLQTDASADLSAFAGGYLNFAIRTTYPGMIEVGFLSGRGADNTAKDVYLLLVPGQYGYLNDGNWRRVSIPIGALVAANAPTFPNERAPDLSKVTSPFVIADRYDFTGKARQSAIRTRIDIDDVFWSR
jgi:exo-beta-1,3-glucanase (GH17 family)